MSLSSDRLTLRHYPDFVVREFHGLNTINKDVQSLPPGTSPDSLNWITSKFKDAIELRRGYKRLGLTEVTGNGKITGLGVGLRYDGAQVPFFSYAQKVKYYDSTLDDTVELGADMLPVAATGEDLWMQPYQNLAGSFMYLGSSNSGIYKVPIANPASAVDQGVTNYRFGVFHIGFGRSFAGQRNGTVAGNRDHTGLYTSYIDHAHLSDYTQTTGEAFANGDGVTLSYSHTLATIAAPKTVMYVSVTDGVETFTDDRNGNMLGSKGGTGTINYATGAVVVNFVTAPTAPITCSYYAENSTSQGILDYSGGADGQGNAYRQDDGGGNLMAIFHLNAIEYCFHLLKTWQLKSPAIGSQNIPYRHVGIPYPYAAALGPEGIIFADVSRPTEPKFRRMQVLGGTTVDTVEPQSLSDPLDLSPYGLDKAVAYRWGDFEVLCVAEKNHETANAYNTIMFIRNVVSGAWDKLNYPATRLATYLGSLIAGDSLSNNVYTLFSGWDEDGDVIPNYWTSSEHNLGTEDIKAARRIVVQGLIQPSQKLKVSIAYDGSSFIDVFVIDGKGDYVDNGVQTAIGGQTIGDGTIGGAPETASPFEVDFKINSDKFKTIRVRFEAADIGFVSVSNYVIKDIRDKGRKNLAKRTK